MSEIDKHMRDIFGDYMISDETNKHMREIFGDYMDSTPNSETKRRSQVDKDVSDIFDSRSKPSSNSPTTDSPKSASYIKRKAQADKDVSDIFDESNDDSNIESVIENNPQSDNDNSFEEDVRPNLYCGNDVCDPNNLPYGYDGCGTRNVCFRKGVGVGIYSLTPEERQDLRSKSKGPDPNRKKIYCGNVCDPNNLPDGYAECGKLHDCLKKGVGVGIYVVSDEQYAKSMERNKNAKARQLNILELRNIAHRLKIELKNANGENKSRSDLLSGIDQRLTSLRKQIS
jgi:hypothetical protein